MAWKSHFLFVEDSEGVCKAYSSARYADGMVSEQTIKEFREAVRKEYGVELNEKDAKEILLNWVAYFDLLAKIDHREKAQMS